MKIQYQPIGVIHTPFSTLEGMPIQPSGADKVNAIVEVWQEYEEGLKDLKGFSHLILIYHFHQSRGFDSHVIPFLDTKPRGVFATRAPKRPNPIGLSTVRLHKVEGTRLHVRGIDVLDGTPLLDIKPWVPEFDQPPDTVQTGWLEEKALKAAREKSDSRFQND